MFPEQSFYTMFSTVYKFRALDEGRGWKRGFRGLCLGGVFVVELIARWGAGGIHMGSIPPADCQCTRLRPCLRVGQADSSQEREVSSPFQLRRDATHLLASCVSRETANASKCVALAVSRGLVRWMSVGHDVPQDGRIRHVSCTFRVQSGRQIVR